VDAVLARTLEDLAEHGIEHLSVERIARAAEVNRSSVYRRWPTREALVAAALARVAADVERRLGDHGSLRGDLSALTDQVAALLEQPTGRALVRGAFAEEGRRTLPQAPLPTAGAPEMVARARARGEWREDARPEVVLAMLVGALLHRAMLEGAPLDASWRADLVGLVIAAVGRA
jgi:AcrR family transcriptional regulator